MHRLTTVLGHYPHMRALRSGAVTGHAVELEFVDFPAVGASFNDMIRDQRYDICEMALGAFMQAVERGAPIRMLPVVAVGAPLHGQICYDASREAPAPSDLAGRRIGVRSYSQTTALWARGILEEEYGLDLDSVTWVVTDEAHVPGFQDPKNVHHVAPRPLADLLRSGEIDVAVLHPSQRPGPELARLVPDAERAAADWSARHQAIPVNHVVCVAPTVWKSPSLIDEVYSMLRESYRMAGLPTEDGLEPTSAGWPFATGGMAMAADLALRQGMLRTPFDAASMLNPS